MRVLASIIVLTLPLAAAAEEPATADAATIRVQRDRCGTGNASVDYLKRGLRVAPLGAEPPAARLLAVYRTEDGCPTPAVLAEGIGANPEKRLPLARAPRTSRLYP